MTEFFNHVNRVINHHQIVLIKKMVVIYLSIQWISFQGGGGVLDKLTLFKKRKSLVNSTATPGNQNRMENTQNNIL